MNQESSFSFTKMEHSVLKFWDDNKTFEESILQTVGKTPYTFYDGPPFATGLPHHGHLLASTIKDIIPRYQTMKGYFVERRFGWDCHGLPIEHEINKQLGMDASEAVKNLGIAGYNNECQKIVMRYRDEWYKTINRIGRWVDFVNDYKTMDTDFMESVWWTFNELWNKGLIYHGTKVVPYSMALETPLSNFEAGSNYQDVQDPSLTIKLECKELNASFLIWTTTPWTLPSNMAIAVHPELTYEKIQTEDQTCYIIASDRKEAYFKEQDIVVLDTYKGQDLVDKGYAPLFPETNPGMDNIHRVIGADFVSAEDGTGLVHCAPAFGEEDFHACKSAGIHDQICPIDKQCRFTSQFELCEGLMVKDADKIIIKTLKDHQKIFHQSTIVHSYPHCPRSDTPLIYRSTPSWYMNVESIKDRMIKNNQKIHWTPSHIKNGRFGKWLEGSKDWALSRNRVWGCPIPIWVNDTTGNMKCFGSIEELSEYTDIHLTNLHREHVDPIEFQIPGEKGTYKRTEEVFDCWFESGAMPYAQIHYPFERKERFEKGYPADFIAEGIDQTRGWFYTLIVLSTALFDVPAFKNIIVNGIVLANDGRKMSKRLKNYTPPDELMEKYGADALRLYLIHSGLVKAEEQRFNDDGVKEMVRKTLLPWYNSFKFLKTYAEVDQWKPSIDAHLNSHHVLDQWILSRLESLKSYIEKHMTNYELYLVVPALLEFLDELTNTYIRLNRQRFWTETMDNDKHNAYETLFHVLHDFSVCMAPFTPFLSEHIFHEMIQLGLNQDKSSIHLLAYPKAHEHLRNPLLEEAVSRLQQIIILGRQGRNQVQIKIKTPLQDLTIYHRNNDLLEEIKLLEDFIKRELNIKNIHYSTHEDSVIELYAKPNSPVLGKRLGKQFSHFKQLIESIDHDQLALLEKGQSITLENEVFSPNDILIFRQAKENSKALSNKLITIELNTELNDDLIEEGLAREIVNRIQKYRKDLDLNVDDRIHVNYHGNDTIHQIMKKHANYIQQETLTLKLNPSDAALDQAFNVNDITFSIQIKKAL